MTTFRDNRSLKVLKDIFPETIAQIRVWEQNRSYSRKQAGRHKMSGLAAADAYDEIMEMIEVRGEVDAQYILEAMQTILTNAEGTYRHRTEGARALEVVNAYFDALNDV